MKIVVIKKRKNKKIEGLNGDELNKTEKIIKKYSKKKRKKLKYTNCKFYKKWRKIFLNTKFLYKKKFFSFLFIIHIFS